MAASTARSATGDQAREDATIREFRGALSDLLQALHTVLSDQDSRDDIITHELNTLAAVTQTAPEGELRDRIQASLTNVVDHYQLKNERARGHIDTLANRLKTVKNDLIEARTRKDIDALTGLKNRGALDESLKELHSQAKLTAQPLCILIADLDFFKSINDTHGHQGGDALIVEFARTIEKCFTRKEDICGRFGGEEFVVLLPNCQLSKARALTHRLVRLTRTTSVAYRKKFINTTCSVGLAQLKPRESEFELLERADKALYAAKKNGRDQYVMAS